MNNKVSLVFEEGKYKVYINESVVSVDEDIDNSFIKFKQTIKNNSINNSTIWESIEQELQELNYKSIEINSNYKTATLGSMKYFHNTGKVFYINGGEMLQLLGGYELFFFVSNLIIKGEISNCEEILDLFKAITESKAKYRVSESTIFVSSAKFSYGSVEYNFSSKKINKGTTLEKNTFSEFKSYVLNILG